MTKSFAGLDWASQIHAVCVIDENGGIRARFEVAHNAAGLTDLCGRLKALDVTAIAIERPSGVVVDVLVEAGFQVVPIHPNVVKATRPRYRCHGGKSDGSDAYLLADILRTDGHRFQPLLPQSDEICALRAMVRGHDDLVAARVSLANELRDLLQSYWPGAAGVFADIDSKIALAFVLRYPSPLAASHLGVKRMEAFCKQHGYSGRRTPEELLQRLHDAAHVSRGAFETEAKAQLATTLANIIAGMVEQLRHLTKQIEQRVASLADGRIIMSFPRAGRLCAAQILSELGSVRERYDTAERLTSEAGATPVTCQSGNHRGVNFRWACNHRLRAAITCFADNSRHESSWAADVYARAKARGCDHPHAIRILARAWLRVMWRAWQDRVPYDPGRHLGAVRHLATAGG